jgi:hypothetical protein
MLEKICFYSFDGEVSEKMKWTTSPKTVQLNDKPYSVASNGHLMVLIDQDRNHEAIDDLGLKAVKHVLDAERESIGSISYSALRKWAGKPGFNPCPTCDGDKTIRRECDYCDKEHKCTCDECGGSGLWRPDARQCVINELPIDQVYIARGLAVVEKTDEEINISYSKGMFVFSTARWQVFVAHIDKRNVSIEHNAPVLKFNPAKAEVA